MIGLSASIFQLESKGVARQSVDPVNLTLRSRQTAAVRMPLAVELTGGMKVGMDAGTSSRQLAKPRAAL